MSRRKNEYVTARALSSSCHAVSNCYHRYLSINNTFDLSNLMSFTWPRVSKAKLDKRLTVKNKIPLFLNTVNSPSRNARDRPLALRGHVTSFLWKWKFHDFAFETLLVGHLLNKIIVLCFFKPAPFAQNKKVRCWSRDQKWIFKIMNYRFLTQILHLNFKETVEKMIWHRL